MNYEDFQIIEDLLFNINENIKDNNKKLNSIAGVLSVINDNVVGVLREMEIESSNTSLANESHLQIARKRLELELCLLKQQMEKLGIPYAN